MIATTATAGTRGGNTPKPGRRSADKANIQAAPTVSYTTPQTFKAGTAITTLSPTSSGVAAPGYNSIPTAIASGIGAPFGVAVDATGNVYVAEVYQSQVQKIPAGGGTPITIGSGFSGPQGVAVDAAGNVYVADPGNSTVKKILAGGSTTVTLGSGFNTPTGVAIDAAGNLYIADYGNNAVKEIPVGSNVPKPLGSGFTSPYGVAVDNNGNVFVSDFGNEAIKKIPAGGGTPVTIATGFATPEGLAVDGAGNVYFVDHNTSTVQMIPAGSSTPITISSAFNLPVGIAVDASGNLIVGDTSNGAIKKLTPSGGYFISPLLPAGLSFNNSTGVISGTPTAGSRATNYTVTAYNSSGSGTAVLTITVNALTINYSTPQAYTAGTAIATLTPTSSGVAAVTSSSSSIAVASGFNFPIGAAVDAGGNLYVGDKGNNAVKKIPAGGGTPVSIGSGFSSPYGVAVDGAGNVYVADAGNNAVKKIPVGGGSVVSIGTGFSNPESVAVDHAGNVYVCDIGSHALKEIEAANGSTVYISNFFGTPSALAVDAWGNIFVTDASYNVVYKIPAAGGQLISIASITNPSGLAVDASGNVYVASHGTNSVYVLVGGSGSPVLLSTAFSYPVGIAADNAGNVYVADQTANLLDKVTPAGGYFISIPLPSGLSFNSSTGKITGKPVVFSPAVNYSVVAYNSYGNNAANINIKVSLPPAPTISYTSPKTYGINNTIAALVPTSANVGAPGYTSGTTTLTPAFTAPLGVAVDQQGNIYEVQNGSGAIAKIAAGTSTVTYIGSGFVTPGGVAVDAAGNVYVGDFNNNAVKKIPVGGGAPISIGTGFSGPCGVAVDAAGNVFVGDFNNSAVKEIRASDGATITLGSGFNHPYGVAVDRAGNVFVADALNGLLKEIPAGSNTPVVIGTGSFNSPYGVATDPEGDLFVADREGNVVKEMVAGTSTFVAVGSGFISPYGAAVDGFGNLYVADYGNNVIKKVAPNGGFYISSPLPTGLNLNVATGVINGKPTVLSNATTYAITAYNLTSNQQANVNIKVISADATLSALALITGTLSPAFAPGTTSYTATVSNATTDISVQPTANFASANINVNGFHVPSGSVSDGISLNQGPNTISIVVTAEDGVTTKTYTIVVTRISSIATLSNIALSHGTLSPAFASGTASYTDMVANGNASVTLTPTASDPNATITVNGTAVKSGAASGAITLAVGNNTVTTIVTAQDGITKQTYTVNVIRPTTNAKLSALKLITATLSPVFNTNTTSYTASVPYTTNVISVQPTAASSLATLTVDGNNLPSGAVSDGIALAVGANTIPIVVTAQDGVTTDTYTIVVTRAAPDVDLSALKLITGTLSPAFAPGTTHYTSTVSTATSDISVQPTLDDPNASMTVQGAALSSGTVSDGIALNYGPNTISIVVTGIDGVTTKTYTIVVTRTSNIATLSNITLSRGTLSPAFATATTSYTDMVANGNSSVTLTPTASDPGATITVNGTAVKSGVASGAITLAVGSNSVTVVVTAQDGVTKDTYTVNVIRPSTNAKLANLTITDGTLTPVFNSNTTSYTVDETNSVSVVSVTPTVAVTGASLTVNGDNLPSGATSDGIALAVGTNTITIIVTAQDGVTTDTYTITVTRNMPGMNSRFDPSGVAISTNKVGFSGDEITVHEGLSPNGDGVNDVLQIDNISNYPDNNLKIMNRNGMLVYEATGYDNSSKVFDGHSNKNGQMQLPGTYFYALDYTVNGVIKHKTGYLVLKY